MVWVQTDFMRGQVLGGEGEEMKGKHRALNFLCDVFLLSPSFFWGGGSLHRTKWYSVLIPDDG